MTPGYSGTPFAKKLGLTRPMRLLLRGAPREYEEWVGELPSGVVLLRRMPAKGSLAAVHLFTKRRAVLERDLSMLRHRLESAGFLRVSWPKKSSKVPTDITEDTIREVALPLGFADIKVCAVSEVWSGLMLVIRRRERPN